ALFSLFLALLSLLIAVLHSAPQRLEIIGKLARTIQRILEALALRLFTRTVRRLHVLQHFIEISLDDAFTFTRLVVPTIGDHLLILPNAIGDSILANRAGRFSELIARLLPILPHPASGLIQIAFEPRNLIRKRLFAFGDLLFLVVACAALLSAFRKLIHAAADFFLPL